MALDRTLSLMVKFGALDRMTAPMRAIGRTSGDTAQSIGKTRAEIVALERAQSRIAKLKSLEEKLGRDSAALTEARTRMEELKRQVEGAEKPTNKLTKALAEATRNVEVLGSTVDKHGQDLQELSTKLGTAGIDVADLGSAEKRLALDIYDANKRLKEQQNELAKTRAARERFEKTRALGESVRGAGYGMTAAGAAIGAPLAATVSPYRDFESGLTDVAQKADLSRQKAKMLGQTLKRLGPDIAQGPMALLTGVDDLLGKGLDPARAMALIRPIGMTATAYKAEMADLTSATYAGIDNLKVPVSQVTRQLDIMAAAGKAGSFEMRDMATHFPMLTASAQALGQSGVGAVADLAAALQIVRKGTGDSGTAANNLQNLLAKINTEDTIKNFRQFGVDLPAELKRAAAAGKSPIEAIAELTNRALGGDQSRISFLFGDMQVQQALRPLIANMDMYRKIRSDALAATGTVEGDFTERMKDDAARQARFAASMDVLSITVGQRLSPGLSLLQDMLAGVALGFTAWANANPRISSTVLTLAAGLAALLVACGTLAIAGGTLVTTWAYFTKSLGVVRTGLRLLITPIVWIAGIIGWPFTLLAIAVLAAGALIYANWDKIKALFTRAKAWLASLDFRKIGTDMLTGLINGLNPLNLVRHIMKLGTRAVAALKNVLGIRSPSRVFAALGGYMADGLAVGVDRGAPRPVDRVRRLARTVAAAGAISAAPIAATPAFTRLAIPNLAAQASRPAPASGGNTYHLHLAMPSTAQDPEAFARRVLEEIRRLERAEARSTYRDD
ncbi:MAG: phage tail tape measure protein [Pseudomonadota bacterium]